MVHTIDGWSISSIRGRTVWTNVKRNDGMKGYKMPERNLSITLSPSALEKLHTLYNPNEYKKIIKQYIY